MKLRIIVPSSLLRTAVVADAVVSGAAALLQVTLATMLSGMLALPRSLVLGTGVFLVAYSLLLVAIARSERVAAALVLLIVVGNVGWAIGGISLLVGGGVSPTGLGTAFVLMQVAAVLIFAALEWAGLRSSRGVDGRTATRSVA